MACHRRLNVAAAQARRVQIVLPNSPRHTVTQPPAVVFYVWTISRTLCTLPMRTPSALTHLTVCLSLCVRGAGPHMVDELAKIVQDCSDGSAPSVLGQSRPLLQRQPNPVRQPLCMSIHNERVSVCACHSHSHSLSLSPCVCLCGLAPFCFLHGGVGRRACGHGGVLRYRRRHARQWETAASARRGTGAARCSARAPPCCSLGRPPIGHLARLRTRRRDHVAGPAPSQSKGAGALHAHARVPAPPPSAHTD
jgi:hypothetical protein